MTKWLLFIAVIFFGGSLLADMVVQSWWFLVDFPLFVGAYWALMRVTAP